MVLCVITHSTYMCLVHILSVIFPQCDCSELQFQSPIVKIFLFVASVPDDTMLNLTKFCYGVMY